MQSSADQRLTPGKKHMLLRLQGAPDRKVAWFDSCTDTSMHDMIAKFVPENLDFLLCDEEGAPVALSPSLPSGLTLELVPIFPRGTDRPEPAVVIVDPISTGAVLAHQLSTRNEMPIVCVWSDVVPEELKHFVAKGMEVEWVGSIQHSTGAIATTVAELRALPGVFIKDVIVGCETGVLLGDELSHALGVRGNSIDKSSLRRNKFLQTEAVRRCGINACGQALATCRRDMEAYIDSQLALLGESSFKAVVKPVEGAGSDGVSICDSPAAVRAAFDSLEGTKNVLGLTNYSVLLQEYLKGDEYVIDTVSRNGVHKCVAIWKYDKRVFNGAPVVYFGMRLLPIDAEPELAAMVDYIFKVLDALGIKNGAMHSEAKLEERGAVLIEVNCRLHGGEGTWAPMAEACLGYSAVSACCDAYLDPAAFAALPQLPINFRAHAMEAKLRSAVEGILVRVDMAAIDAIRALDSYRSEMISVEVGQPIARTVDAVSACGNINLVNEDLSALERDYAKLHEIVEKGIFFTK